MHRYTSADSLAYHLEALRYRARNRVVCDAPISDPAPAKDEEQKPESLVHFLLVALSFRDRQPPNGRLSDVVLAEQEEGTRNMLFKRSSSLLVWSAALLFMGLVLFCISMASVMF